MLLRSETVEEKVEVLIIDAESASFSDRCLDGFDAAFFGLAGENRVGGMSSGKRPCGYDDRPPAILMVLLMFELLMWLFMVIMTVEYQLSDV